MANPFVKITPDPLFMNADGIPDALSARRPLSSGEDGAPGVLHRSDLATTFNAGMGITVSGGEAFVKGQNITNQGMYYCYASSATYNITVNPSPPAGNSRIDQVVLRVFDDPHDGSGLSEGRIEVLEGVPQATADLNQNRDAAAANLTTLSSPPSKSLLLLADILVTGGASTLSAGVIRDRRKYAQKGGVSNLVPANDVFADVVVPEPHPSITMIARGALPNPDVLQTQSAMLVWLSRSISANKLIFKYRIDNAPGPSINYMVGICDASGRVIFNANNQALTTTPTGNFRDVITMPLTTFDPGYYWYVFGLANPSANGTTPFYFYGGMGNTVYYPGATTPCPNVMLYSQTGGAVFPASKTILGYTDAYSVGFMHVHCPLYTLAR